MQVCREEAFFVGTKRNCEHADLNSFLYKLLQRKLLQFYIQAVDKQAIDNTDFYHISPENGLSC